MKFYVQIFIAFSKHWGLFTKSFLNTKASGKSYEVAESE